MAELGHNYNIQCMKLFQELKAAYPATPDDLVRQCMKANRNVKEKCLEDLEAGSQHPQGRFGKGRYNNGNRRLSVGSVSDASLRTANMIKPRTNSLCEPSPIGHKFWALQRGSDRRPLRCLPTNCDKRGGDGSFEPPRKISRHCEPSPVTDSVADADIENSDCDVENCKKPPTNKEEIGNDWRRRGLPRSLSLASTGRVAEGVLPTVMVTPDSPPQDTAFRTLHTLYRPGDEATVHTRVITSESPPQNSLEKEISSALGAATSSKDSLMICGRNNSITNTFIDILPGLDPVSLPFGEPSISEVGEVAEGTKSLPGPSITQSTTSLSQGTVHCLRDVGDGTISIATTTYCGIQHSVVSPTGGEKAGPLSSKSTTVLYSVNRKPVICENPFRKVFTRRKQFYQAKEDSGRPTSPETSSKRLIWRHHNHNCSQEAGPSLVDPLPNEQKYFTLNANIQPFDPFIIKHSLPTSPAEASSPGCASVNLTLCGESDSVPPSVHLLPDGSGLKYMTRVEEDGTEASLEVNVKRDQSTITTLRTGTSDCTSNEISVKLVAGGNMVNIQQSQSSFPRQAPVRPSSLHIPGPKYATTQHAKSVCQGRGTSPCTSPRYNSLPNLKGVMYENNSRDPTWGYQSHPKDEERKLAFTRALLSHQLEQMFKLERELRQEKQEMGVVKSDVQELEMKVKQQAFSIHSQSTKVKAGEVRRLNSAIGDLRGDCDSMVKKVTTLTGGKVPLGEDSIKDYKPYLSQDTVPDSPHCDTGAAMSSVVPPGPTSETLGRWNCSECTFANHPSLATCEICEMPRITMGQCLSKMPITHQLDLT